MLKLLLKLGAVVALIKETREAYVAIQNVYTEAQDLVGNDTRLGKAITSAQREMNEIQDKWDALLGAPK